ncbi:MAG: amidase [Phycisphaerales bacterium]
MNESKRTRRQFIAGGTAAAVTAAALPLPARSEKLPMSEQEQQQQDTGITQQTIAEAEKLAGVEFTPDERAMIARSIGSDAQGYRERRRFTPPNGLGPACVFDPQLPGISYDVKGGLVLGDNTQIGPLPTNPEDIAFAPLSHLAAWLQRKEISSVDLTKLYIARLKQHGPKLECVITLTEDRAMQHAQAADREIAAGNIRSHLHGIPWGAKDLLDTKGIRTTYGAMPWRERIADADATVVQRLDEAGAVLVAKLTLGALAYGDIWFDGRTNNPFNVEQGSSGSSAGSAAATAAGLVAFALGTETLGSIVSPCMRCGTTGLRPTFGRVARTGAMALCWSLDKIGPICRTADDCARVLAVINGGDVGDPSSRTTPFAYDATRPIKGLRVGYDPTWFTGRRVSAMDKAMLEHARELELELVEISLPDLPYSSLRCILMAEAASAFEEITLSNSDDTMRWQSPEAWPNAFRQSRFIPAIEVVQAERLRRHCMSVMHDAFANIDAMIGPSFAGPMLLVTNNTGHPSITFRNGMESNGTPHGFTIWGRLYDEGTICSIATAMQQRVNVWDVRPKL